MESPTPIILVKKKITFSVPISFWVMSAFQRDLKNQHLSVSIQFTVWGNISCIVLFTILNNTKKKIPKHLSWRNNKNYKEHNDQNANQRSLKIVVLSFFLVFFQSQWFLLHLLFRTMEILRKFPFLINSTLLRPFPLCLLRVDFHHDKPSLAWFSTTLVFLLDCTCFFELPSYLNRLWDYTHYSCLWLAVNTVI